MTKIPLILKSGQGEKLNVLGTQVTLLCEGDKTEKAWSLIEVTLPQGGGPPPHDHPWDEAYYVVAGEVKFMVGEQVHMVKAGDFVYAPGGTLHSFQGASQSPARVLVFDAPAAAGGFFRDIDREIKSMPQDLPKVLEIGARHRLRFVL